MSDGDLEKRCETDDIHISNFDLPIVSSDPPVEQIIVDDDSPADSAIYGNPNAQNTEPYKQMDRIAVHAPLGDPKFWLLIHLKLVSYALQRLSEAKEIAEVRGEVLESSVVREYHEKKDLEKELRKAKLAILLKEADIANAIFAAFEADDRRDEAEKQRDDYKQKFVKVQESLKYSLETAAKAERTIEGKETIIKIYERLFGSREKLAQLLNEQEECAKRGKKCKKENYNCIDKLIDYHHNGKCPKTFRQHVAYCAERITDGFVYLMEGIYSRLIGKSASKEAPVKINDCG